MEVISVHESGISESCPGVNGDGHFHPNDNQLSTILSPYGHLNRSLTNNSIIQWGDAPATLASATVFRLLFLGFASAPAGFGGANNPDLATAIADLSVTGENNYLSFQSSVRVTIDTEDLVSLPLLKEIVFSRLEEASTRLGVTLDVPLESIEVRDAIDFVVERAVRVIWALNGPSEHKQNERASLGWIAVNAERDQPRRPVNTPCAIWPTTDCNVSFTIHGRTFTCRTRYAIDGSQEAFPEVSLDTMPVTNVPPIMDPEAIIFIFLHGHSSGLEEAGGIFAELKNECEKRSFPKPIALVSFDFPSNGYSQYLDHEEVAPLATTTHYVPDHPEERRFGMLEFYETFVVAFVEALDSDLRRNGQPGILNRIAAIIGGSMGGNLTLRLSERLVTNPWWLNCLVSWSPASVYESFGNKDPIIPSPGEEVDPIGYEALDRAFQRCQQREGDDSRADFMAIQLNGERLINDGTPGFEAMTRILGVLLQPLLGGLAPFLPIVGPLIGPFLSGVTGPVVFGSAGLEGVANITVVKQSDEWLREDCRAGYDETIAAQNFLFGLQERYSSIRRRTHWRVAYEQLLFSHQDRIARSRGRQCYEISTVRTLLIAGSNDTTDKLTGFDIYGGVRKIAPLMVNNPGKAIFIDNTGHSIHAERPKWLAREIIDFIRLEPEREIIAVSRREGGGITRLYFKPVINSISNTEAIRQTLARGGAPLFYFLTDSGERQNIYARRFLSTTADDTEENNLRSLPITSLPLLTGSDIIPFYGPATGFQVTHIRLRTARPEPWNTWVSHLCNDALGFQIPTQEAEIRILDGSKRFFIVRNSEEYELNVREYLHTEPNETEADNLSRLREPDGIFRSIIERG